MYPQPEHVVLNLTALYQDAAFKATIEQHAKSIRNFADGIGRYGNSQSEVIIEISDLSVPDVHALGGFSSNRDDVARLFFGRVPTSEELACFDNVLEQSGEQLGPVWMDGAGLDRVVKRMQPHVERLKEIKAAQQSTQAQ